MISAFAETKLLNEMVMQPKTGNFAIDKEDVKNLSWQHCRETFGDQFTENTPSLYFCHGADQSEAVASFISKVEDVLHISAMEIREERHPLFFSNCEPTVFAKTNRNNIIWVKPSKFWMSVAMRRSLFTVLLRCGRQYNPKADNFQEALYSDNYIVNTKDAVKRFLFGFTDFITDEVAFGNGRRTNKGWVNCFQNKSVDEIRKQLKCKNPPKSEIAAIWT